MSAKITNLDGWMEESSSTNVNWKNMKNIFKYVLKNIYKNILILEWNLKSLKNSNKKSQPSQIEGNSRYI